MNGISVVSVPDAAPEGSPGPNHKPGANARRRRVQRLAFAVTPLVVTVITAAPALAWPEGAW